MCVCVCVLTAGLTEGSWLGPGHAAAADPCGETVEAAGGAIIHSNLPNRLSVTQSAPSNSGTHPPQAAGFDGGCLIAV